MDCSTPDLGENKFLEAAATYAQAGFRCFPCNAAKVPFIKGWPKLATTDMGQLAKWWAKWPSANIGIATGEDSGLLVLDIDVKGDSNGFTELEAFSGYPIEDIEAPRYKTPSGGQQVWFSYPVGNDVGIASKAHISGLSIDTRANGGYACVPPSHTANGDYEWIVDPEEFDELPRCPTDLLDLLREPGKPKGKSKGGQSQSVIADAEGYTLENHPGAGDGLRNGLLVVLVGKWLSDHPQSDWRDLEKLVIAWNDRCKPAKAEALALKPALYLWNKELDAPKLLLDNLVQPQHQATAKKPKDKAPPNPKQDDGGVKLMVRQASTITPLPVEWLWQSRLQLKALNVIAGPEGKGKSLLVSDCAARVSTGGDWPDGAASPKGRVLYCSAEEDASATVVPRLIAAGADLEMIDIVDGLGKAGTNPEDAMHIDLGKHLPQLYQQLKERGDYLLVIFDTFQSVSLQTEHKSNTNQKQVAQPLAKLSTEFELTMLCVEHHSRGGLQRGNPDNAILGAGLVRTARAIWHVLEDPDDDKVRLFLPGKLNNANRDAEDLSWRFQFREVMVEMGDEDAPVPVIDWIEASGKTLNEVRDAAIGEGEAKGQARPKEEFANAVKWLQDNLTDPTPSAVMKDGLKMEGISKGTEQRAREHLHIKTVKPGKGSDEAGRISKLTGIPVEDLPEFDGRGWWWFPPPKLVIDIPLDDE